ncbi:uncharacterized protein LOC144458674 [Epinephelus lanceolatus]
MELAGDHNRGQAMGRGRQGRHGGQRIGRGHAPLLRGGHEPHFRGVGERGRGHGHRPRQQQQRVSNEIRAIVVAHVVNHGMTMTEAARMIQPNLRRSTVASIIRTFRTGKIETRPNSGGRGKILTDEQERAVVNLVRARNDIRLSDIRQHILDNDDIFNNVEAISLPTIARVLKRHQVSLKQLYRVPFERNAERVKQLRTEYVQVPPCSRGASMVSGPSTIHHPVLTPYSSFLNPIEEFFSTWRWKVYDRRPHEQVTPVLAMDAMTSQQTSVRPGFAK